MLEVVILVRLMVWGWTWKMVGWKGDKGGAAMGGGGGVCMASGRLVRGIVASYLGLSENSLTVSHSFSNSFSMRLSLWSASGKREWG